VTADPRSRRVDELVREALALALIEDIKDPRLELVTVTGAEVSRDRRYARIYVTAHGGEERYAEVIGALDHAAGRLKAGLSRRVRMRYTPDLAFSIDRSVDEGMRISRLLAEHESAEDEE
jgi:ribosome-binding factor A